MKQQQKRKKKSTMGAVQFFFLNSHISFYIVAYLGLASCWVLSHQEDTGFLYPSRVPIEYAGCNGGKSFSTQAANDQQQAFHMYIKILVVTSMYSLLNYFLPFYEIQITVKSQAVDWSTIQFWNFLAKGYST